MMQQASGLFQLTTDHFPLDWSIFTFAEMRHPPCKL
jgi:hypothetical protein